jgi:hypothetical protein
MFSFLIGLRFVRRRGQIRLGLLFVYRGSGSIGCISCIKGLNDDVRIDGGSIGSGGNGCNIVGAISAISGIGTASTTTRAGAGSMVMVSFKGFDGLVVLKSMGT